MTRKITLLVTLLIVFVAKSFAFAQPDTLLFEDFSEDPSDYIIVEAPAGISGPGEWVNYDEDGISDDNNRPQMWFWSAAFSDLDGGTDNGTYASSSWLAGFVDGNRNWLITPQINIVDSSAVLSWKSAPRQLPVYMDGYTVLVSTTTNLEDQYRDTLMVFAQYISHSGTNFVYSPGIVHDFYEENTDDPLRHIGRLKEWTVSLKKYAGKRIYIAFLHNSDDDNLISVDDILVTGTPGVVDVAVEKRKVAEKFSVYPVPAKDVVNISVSLEKTTPVAIEIRDLTGKLIDRVGKGTLIAGDHDLQYNSSNLPAGNYFISLVTPFGQKVSKIVVVK
jgi:hypothetical protein